MKKQTDIYIFALFIVTMLTILCGIMQTTLKAKAAGQYGVDQSNSCYSSENIYSAPQCTWYCWGRAAEKCGVRLPGFGNAKDWYNNAASAGHSVGQEPRENSIAVFNDVGTSLSGYGHVVFIEKIVGTTAYYTEGNYKGSEYYHEGSFDTSQKALNPNSSEWRHNLVGYIYLSGDNEAPQITNYKVESVNSSGYTVSCTITDNVGVTKVLFPTWTASNGQDDISWQPYTAKSWNTYYFTVNISDHNNERGTYLTHVYAYDAAGNNSFEPMGIYVPEPDTEAPKITNFKVESVDCSGYTVSCTVTDNVGVKDVVFPTWTAWNGQDDLPSVWQSYTAKSGDTYYFTVNISDHNYESGQYITHVYAYDEDGNSAKDTMGAIVPEYEIIYNANGGSGAPEKQFKEKDTNVILSNATPTRSGYNFNGWNTAANGSGTSYAAGATYTVNNSVTLYAQWKANTSTSYKKGDVNGDGTIDVKDKKLVLYHIRGINKLSGNGFNAGDVNGDGVVDVKDKKLILYHIRGINTIK